MGRYCLRPSFLYGTVAASGPGGGAAQTVIFRVIVFGAPHSFSPQPPEPMPDFKSSELVAKDRNRSPARVHPSELFLTRTGLHWLLNFRAGTGSVF